MTRLELTVILLLGILGSFAFSKKPDPLTNKKKVSWVTKTGSVRHIACVHDLEVHVQARDEKPAGLALDRRLSNRAATSDVVVDDFSILFQNNEKIRWRAGIFYVVIMVFAKYVQPLSIKFVLRVSGIKQMYVITTWTSWPPFLSLIASSSFSFLLSTCLVLQHGSFVPREWQAGPPCPFAIEVKCLPSLSPQIGVFYLPFTSLV